MTSSLAGLPAGARINDRYEIICSLGGGSNGHVYRVADEHLANEVALKLLAPKAGQPATWDEAQVLEHLRSDFLLRVFNADVVSASDIRYVTTALMLGGDLEEAAKPHGVTPAQAIRWGQQVAHGLERMHAAGLVHRDVKPANAYLNESSEALLGDLGMAARLSTAGTAPPDGTPVTVAPEVWSRGPCTVRSDVYSLAATVFYLLTGEYPVDHRHSKPELRDRALAGLRRHVRDLAPYVTRSLGRVIERGLSTDPNNRQPTALQFANELAASRLHARHYERIVAHEGHGVCVRSAPTRSARELCVCVVPVSDKFNIEVALDTGRHLRRHEKASVESNRLAQVLRRLFEDL
jgi:serine/threonine-protein kinase